MLKDYFQRKHFWQRLWPQAPIAVVIIASGLINLFFGLQADELAGLITGALPQLGDQSSMATLGGGAQVIFGAGLVLTGIGLFWRVRVAWAFAVLLLLVTVGVNLAQSQFGGTLILPGVMLLALIGWQRHFSRRTLFGTSLVSLVSIVAVIAYGTLGIYLLGEQFDPHITSLVTALYFLVETLSTTGYGDFGPATETAQIFMITVWIVGLGVFGTAIVSVAGPIFAKQLDHFFTPGRKRRMKKDHVILVGSGSMATNAAQELLHREIDFIQLVGPKATPPLPEQPVINGDASDDAVLRKAGIQKARMLIAAEDDDGENAFISLAAKDINPNIQVLITASSRRSMRRLKLAGADIVFAPADVGSRLLANLVQGEQLPEQFMDLLERNTPR